MIKPTIGRVVWFWPASLAAVSQPQAAIITWVDCDTLVNLAVFDASGATSGRTRVPLYQGDGDRPLCSFCEWMPYQIRQAAKEPRVVLGGVTAG